MKNTQNSSNNLNVNNFTTAFSQDQNNSVVTALKSIFCKNNNNVNLTIFCNLFQIKRLIIGMNS